MSITRIDKIIDNLRDLEIEISPSVLSSFPRIRKIEIFPVIPTTENGGADPGSLLFNNTNQFLQFSRAGVISITDPAAPFTIEAWIKPTAIKTIVSVDGNGNPDPLEYGNIIVGDTEGGGNNWSLQLFNNKLSFYRFNDSLIPSYKFYTAPTTIPINEWTHVAVSYDGTNTLSIFINGVLDASFADYVPPNIQYSVITVGNLFDTGSSIAGGGAYAYEGYITNLRINDDEYFYQIVNPFLSTAPLGNIAGTALRLLADQNDPIKDSGPNNVTITNVGSVTSSSEYPAIYDCANNDAKVLMVGWFVGPRALTRSSNLLYVYGDETVERANTNSAWVYKNSGSTISTATSVTEYPWQAEWDNGVTATKICASISSFVYDSSNALVDHIFGNIPESWQGNNANITQLVLGSSVTSIGNYAFQTCSALTGNLTIPNSVTSIGNYAFEACSNFTGSLTIGDSVTSILEGAFKSCTGFTGSLTIPNSVTSIGSDAFYNCSGFTGSLTIPNSITSLGGFAFANCSGLTGSLTIPNSVTSIGDYAFRSCSGFTGSLTIGSGVTTIGNNAFYYTDFTGDLIVPDSVTNVGSYAFYGCTEMTGVLVISENLTSISNYAFGYIGCSGTLTIPEFVTIIGKGSFSYNYNFTGTLVIPDSVTSIGEYAFGACYTSFDSLVLGNSVETIGDRAFYDCNSISGALTIPDSVTSIGNQAFQFNQLTSVTIGDSVTSIESAAFRNNQLTSATIGDSVTSIGSYAFAYNQLASVTIPDSVTSIGSSAFRTNQLTSVTIGNSVTSIGNGAFRYNQLASVTIPDSVTSIGNYAFGSNQLTSVTIPDSVTSIGSSAFRDNQLTSVTIGNSVISIGDYAFYQNQLTAVTIPDSVTSIGGAAFADNVNLATVDCYTTQTAFVDSAAFYNTASPLTIHARATDATWTAGTGLSFQENTNVTVIKDL